MGASQSQSQSQSREDNSIKPQYEEINIQRTQKTAVSDIVDGNKAKEKEKADKNLQLPHNYEAILKDADSPVDTSSIGILLSQLHAGVFLNQKRKKYWVDKNSNKNCFMLFARDLSITWGEDNRFWKWSHQKETTSDVMIDVAELVQVCWLELQGKFDVAKLSPGTLYGVVFVVMLREAAYGWKDPVKFRVTLPNGQKIERKQQLMNKPREEWIEIPVAEFTTSSQDVGELEIYIHEYDTGEWKAGLIVKGVAIVPKISYPI